MPGRTSENLRVDGMTNQLREPIPLIVGGHDDLAELRGAWAELDSTPCLLRGRDEGIDHSWPGVDIRTLLNGDNSSGRISYHDLRLEPGAGFPTHYQESSHTFLFVLEGEVNMTVGSRTEPSGRGSIGYIPPRTTQAFRNDGKVPAGVLLFYLPAGADRAFAEAHRLWESSRSTAPEPYFEVLGRYGFRFDATGPLDNDALTNGPVSRLEADVRTIDDLEALRRSWTAHQPVPKIEHHPLDDRGVGTSGDARQLRVHLVNGDEDQGSAFFRNVVVIGGAGPHHQPSEEEAFFVLSGQVHLTCGSATELVGPGAFAFAPRNATHAFANARSGQPSQVLAINSPAGHERAFEMLESEMTKMAQQKLSVPPEDFWDKMEAYGWTLHDPSQMYGEPVETPST